MNRTIAAAMIRDFELGKYPKEKWTHQAHFVMAFWYCYHQPLPQAIRSIKDGIRHYNVCVGGQNTEDSGYHETITVFYTREVVRFLSHSSSLEDVDQLLENLLEQPFLKKDYLSNFYTRETLMGREARARWVEPDIYG